MTEYLRRYLHERFKNYIVYSGFLVCQLLVTTKAVSEWFLASNLHEK